MKIKQILLTTFLTVSSLNSFATDYYIAAAVLNVRTGEGTEYPVSFTIQKGDEVEVLSKDSSWYRIKYFGKTGYAHSKYLKYSRTISDIELDTPNQTESFILAGVCVSLTLFVVSFSLERDETQNY